jgi:hypothetical protein
MNSTSSNSHLPSPPASPERLPTLNKTPSPSSPSTNSSVSSPYYESPPTASPSPPLILFKEASEAISTSNTPSYTICIPSSASQKVFAVPELLTLIATHLLPIHTSEFVELVLTSRSNARVLLPVLWRCPRFTFYDSDTDLSKIGIREYFYQKQYETGGGSGGGNGYLKWITSRSVNDHLGGGSVLWVNYFDWVRHLDLKGLSQPPYMVMTPDSESEDDDGEGEERWIEDPVSPPFLFVINIEYCRFEQST